MPGRREAHATAVVNGKIFIFGGISVGGGFAYSNLWVYDPPTDTWHTLSDMPLKWSVMGYSVVNERVYLMAGSSEGSFPFPNNNFKRVEEYNPHNVLLLLLDNVSALPSYAVPGADNVLISTKINNPTGITLFAEIEAPDQTPVNSVELFDDGNHNDGSAGDSLFANSWLVPPVEESNYYIDLQVTRVDTDTVFQELNNMALFTTIGPVVVDHYDTSNTSTGFTLKLYLRNNGLISSATWVRAEISTSDTNVTDIGLNNRYFGDIAPGQIKASLDYIITTQGTPGSIDFIVYISSEERNFWSDTIRVIFTGIEENKTNIPIEHSLKQNYPNPFNPATSIKFSIPKSEFVTLKIYNTLGQEVVTLVSEKLIAGSYKYDWDAGSLASSVYLYRIRAGNYVEVKKMLLLK
jgi:hypothetical protein